MRISCFFQYFHAFHGEEGGEIRDSRNTFLFMYAAVAQVIVELENGNQNNLH